MPGRYVRVEHEEDNEVIAIKSVVAFETDEDAEGSRIETLYDAHENHDN